MKVFIVLAVCVAAVSAGKTHYGTGSLFGPVQHHHHHHRAPLAVAAPLPVAVAAPVAPVATVSTGTSSQFRSEDNYGNYNFGYDEAHATGSTSRREEQTNGVRRGSYSLSDADGRRRVVNYIADAAGFRASIQTNEPGVEPKDPADTLINKEAPVAVAVAAPVAAPLPAPVAAPLPAPVALQAPVKGYYSAPAPVAVAPAPVVAAPVAAVIEEPTPRAFSYSFGATHLAPAAVAAPAPIYAQAPLPAPLPAPVAAPLPAAPIAAPAPIYQQQIIDY